MVIKYEKVQMDSCMLTEKPAINNEEPDAQPTVLPLVTERKLSLTTPIEKSYITKVSRGSLHGQGPLLQAASFVTEQTVWFPIPIVCKVYLPYLHFYWCETYLLSK